MSAVLAVASCGFAQGLNKSEAKALQSFMTQTSANGVANGSALGLQGKNLAGLPGVKVSDGHVTEIDWSGKNLAGSLNLSDFPALQKINVSGNKLTSLTISNDPALTEVNASKNRLTEFSVASCPQLQTIRINRNRLAEINLTQVPFLKKLNISGNQFEALDVTNAVNLESLNCMSNRLQNLNVAGCQNPRLIDV